MREPEGPSIVRDIPISARPTICDRCKEYRNCYDITEDSTDLCEECIGEVLAMTIESTDPDDSVD